MTLKCFGGVEFVGEPVGTVKLAEASAARAVLKHYEDEVAVLATQSKNKKSSTKRIASTVADAEVTHPPEKVQKVGLQQSSLAPKSEINQICMKVAQRTLDQDDIVYNSRAVEGGFLSTLQLFCLPGSHGQYVFTGTSICGNVKESEATVAAAAVQILKADKDIVELLNKPKAKKNKKR